MIPETWTELTLQTSPQFLEEIGFYSAVPSGHPISVLAKAKEYFRQQSKEHFRKLYLKRQRYCLLYYDAGDPRAYDGRIGIEVEWWGPCSEIISTVNSALGHSNSTLGADDASPTHALLHDRLANRWWLAPFQECQRFVREQNEELP